MPSFVRTVSIRADSSFVGRCRPSLKDNLRNHHQRSVFIRIFVRSVSIINQSGVLICWKVQTSLEIIYVIIREVSSLEMISEVHGVLIIISEVPPLERCPHLSGGTSIREVSSFVRRCPHQRYVLICWEVRASIRELSSFVRRCSHQKFALIGEVSSLEMLSEVHVHGVLIIISEVPPLERCTHLSGGASIRDMPSFVGRWPHLGLGSFVGRGRGRGLVNYTGR